MNSTPNSNNKSANAKSTPQEVFNYAQAAKRNSQNLEKKPDSSSPGKPASDNANVAKSNVNGAPSKKAMPKQPASQQTSKPSFASVANSSSKASGQHSRNASVQLPQAPPDVDKSSIQFGSINQAAESTNDVTTAKVEIIKTEVTFGTVSASEKTSVQSQSPQLHPPASPASSYQQHRRDSTHSNHSAVSGDHSPANSPHYQHRQQQHYNGPRHYNQNKHNYNYSPNMQHNQPAYAHPKKPMSPHMPAAPAPGMPVQNSWGNAVPPNQYYQGPPQTYPYNYQMPVQYANPEPQQVFTPPQRSRAIAIVNPLTKEEIKPEVAPSSPSKSAKPAESKEKDFFKLPSTTTTKVTMVDPAVKEREERERLEREEEERLAKEEAERLAKEEAERKLKEEEERKAKEEAERLAKEEAERLAKEEEERKTKEEEERKAKEEEERKAKEEADRKAKEEEAERLAKEEADRMAREDAERKEVERVKRQLDAEKKAAAAVDSPSASPSPQPETEAPATTATPAAAAADEKATDAPVDGAKSTGKPGRLDIASSIPNHVLEGEGLTQSPTTPARKKAAAIPRRKIADFDSITYPESVTKRPTGNISIGPIQYHMEFMTQFRTLCLDCFEDLSAFQDIGRDDNEQPRQGRQGSMQRRQTSERGRPRTPGTPTGEMYGGRHGSRDGRMDSMGKFAGGRPLSHRAGSGGMPGSPGSPGPMQREGSHGGRSRSGRGGKGRHPPREQPGGPTIPLDQVVPLEKSENRWMPTVVATGGDQAAVEGKADEELIPQDVIARKVKALLNKLTLERFDSISDKIWDFAHQSANEKDGETVRAVIQLIFDKACDEPGFAKMWAQLCHKLHVSMSAADDIHDESNTKDKKGNPVTSGHLFRMYLFNRCQQAFERGWKVDMPDVETTPGGEAMLTDEYYAAVKAKRQGLGLVQFIGELYKLNMLTERIMFECLTRLCRDPQNAEEEETETMCKLVTTVGKVLENRNRNTKTWMEAYFERMKEMLEAPTLSSRVKFMVMDVLDLRKHKWIPRTNQPTGPTTIAQIREEAQQKKNEEKEIMKRAPSSRGHTPQVMSRQGSRAGRNLQREGTKEGANSPSADGWNTVGGAAGAAPKGRNDLANFGKADRSKSRSNVLGPANSPFANLSRTSSKNAANDSKKGSPVDSRSSSPASSMTNMFSALGDEEERPVERKRLNLLPRGSTLADDDSVAAEDDDEEKEEAAKPQLTEQQIEQKAKNIIEEYTHLRDAKELLICVKELDQPVALVNKMLGSVEKKEDDMKAVCEIIAAVNKEGLVQKEHYIEALKPFMEFYEDLTIDVPQAPKFVSRLLVAMDVDPAEVMEIEEPEESGYVPASAKLKELFDAAKASQ
ncbi:hypothetical protein DM01DRAFT_1384800 [Hesseltinella vesiculosa]|uniref:MIF4G domain-containing protein n=1 Tax=Hesseltinella vesiculosa TaxID=101127 RepID=A0A1X2GCJ1_9FUNG|nr:hypothetical protein DM01DRAFT_1384800 [Hesseltinella vesiculosa]